MPLTEGQFDVLALLLDGVSIAEIEDLCETDEEQIYEEVVTILEVTGTSSIQEVKHLVDTYGLEVFSATRH